MGKLKSPRMEFKARMGKLRNPHEMGLGDLIDELQGLKGNYGGKLVDKDFPYSENYNKFGGIAAYNTMVEEEYKERRRALVSELNRRGPALPKPR